MESVSLLKVSLKVHKNENFFGSYFEFVLYFIVGYAEILRFKNIFFLIGPLLGEI
jgi:hypothetical protein